MDNICEKITEEGLVIPIYKPTNWTSFDIVKYVRGVFKKHTQFKKIKVGHAGTLDPLATGLLIVCVGKKTKEIYKYQDQKKTYIATFKLGATTPSYDLETNINETFSTSHINIDLIKETIKDFLGDSEQIPPAFSALKIGGKRSYDLARSGKKISLESRKINISKFEILDFKNDEVDCKIECSKGTYIRSIAYDLGKKLRSGAYLKYLERYSIGNISLKDAIQVDKISKKFNLE